MRIKAVQYSLRNVNAKSLSSLENVEQLIANDSILWLDISQYQKLDDLTPLEKSLKLHPLALDDCINIRQRPKLDDFQENIFLICRTVTRDYLK
jgi:magnesium transporter